MKIWVQPHGLTIQIYFRQVKSTRKTEMHISMCTFGSEIPIWGSTTHSSTQINFTRAGPQSWIGNTPLASISDHSSRETAVSRDRLLNLSMAIPRFIRDR